MKKDIISKLARPHNLFLGTVSALIITLAGQQASAQIADQTRSADPSRAEEQIFIQDTEPRIQVTPIDIKDVYVDQMPANAEQTTFTLNQMMIDGVSVYKEGELTAFYAEKLGKTISVADLYKIAAQITRYYRNNGYILAQAIVPAQNIEGGAAKLEVVEGFIDNVTVEGEDEPKAIQYIRDYAAKIKLKGGALNVNDLERWLLLIGDLPGVTARSVLSPSSTTPGAADLKIIIERDKFEAEAGVDSYGSRYLGPIQLTGKANVNSLMGRNEKITAYVVYAPTYGLERELFYTALRYEQPILRDGLMLDVYGSLSETDPGYTLDPFDVRGTSRFLSAALKYPLIRSRSHNITLRGQLDYRHLESNSNIPSPVHDDIISLRLGSRFEYLDRLLGGLAFSVFDIEASKGIDLINANSEEGDPFLSRALGDPQYFKVTAEYQRLQRINEKLNLLVATRGQWASNALLSSEEFGIGGINYGRAYDPSEIIGDHGIAGKIEFQLREPIKIEPIDTYQLFAFFDAGRIWNEDATTSSLQKDTITSTGFGFRADFTKTVSGGLIASFPLNRRIQTRGDRDTRYYFNILKKF